MPSEDRDITPVGLHPYIPIDLHVSPLAQQLACSIVPIIDYPILTCIIAHNAIV